ncbi:MAG: chorismate mutase [Candidatus Omnitrophica bacterium]|nr:chorismate mutase [Candidatus Omnitrophota bacterium]
MKLAGLRRGIDRIDLGLLRLLNRRAALALRIGRVKKKRGLPVVDERRERTVVDRLLQRNGGPLPRGAVRKIFGEILRQNRRLQAKAGARGR